MVEFSWNSRSTSMSKLHVVMHQVIPPTTWGGGTRRQEEGERCDKLVFVYFVKLPEPEIEMKSRSQFSKTWPVLPRLWILCVTLSKGDSPLILALKYPAASSSSRISASLTLCSSSSRVSTWESNTSSSPWSYVEN